MPDELILVVDDEPDILGLCDRILSSDGYTVYTASSGGQAVDIAQETPFDVVILDIKMPNGDGISVFERIRQYQPEIVGIVITGYPSMEAAIDALKKGFSGFVLKPFTPDELRQAVADALDRQRLKQDYARLQALVPLYDLSRSLMTTTDVDTLLEQAVQIAVQETQADRASLMLKENDHLRIAAARGLPEEILDTTVTPIGNGIAGWVAQHGEPLLLNPGVSMPPELADALNRDEIGSAVCVPLALQDRVIGVLNLSKFEPAERPFTPSERDLITVLAGQVAIAIENARLFRQQRSLAHDLSRANANMRGLQQAATAIASRLDPEDVLQTALDGCVAVLEDATIAIGLLDPASGTIEVHLHDGQTQSRKVKRVPLSGGDAEMIWGTSGTADVLETRLRELLDTLAQPSSVGIIPLSAHDQLQGSLAVGTQQALGEAGLMALKPFADQAAVAIANAQLFTQIQHAYDELQVLDRVRGEFMERAARRLQTPLAGLRAHLESRGEVPADKLEEEELQRLRQATDELAEHLDGLEKLRQLQAGQTGLQRERTAVAQVITVAIDSIEPTIKAREQTLQIHIPTDLGVDNVDPAKLKLAIVNLILAISDLAQPDDKIVVEAGRTNDDLRISTRGARRSALPQEQPQIIVDAVREPYALTRESADTVKLSAAYRFAKRHGGDIQIDEVSDNGELSFTLILPLSPYLTP